MKMKLNSGRFIRVLIQEMEYNPKTRRYNSQNGKNISLHDIAIGDFDKIFVSVKKALEALTK